MSLGHYILFFGSVGRCEQGCGWGKGPSLPQGHLLLTTLGNVFAYKEGATWNSFSQTHHSSIQ